MKAAVLTAHGEPPTYAEHPGPTAKDGHVLVRVTASPVSLPGYSAPHVRRISACVGVRSNG